MSFPTRIGPVAVLVLASTMTAFDVVAAPPSEPPQGARAPRPIAPLAAFDVGESRSVRLPQASRRDVQLYRAALQRLEEQRYDEAIGYLQVILDSEIDGFIEIADEPPAKKRVVSLRESACRAIEGLTGDARTFYRQRYEPAARSALSEALAAGDVSQLIAVARRFPGTAAGHEASWRLALANVDRGEILPAIARLEELRPVVAAERRPVLLMRLAACYGKIGDDERRDLLLRELEATAGPLSFAGRTKRIDDAGISSAVFPPTARRRIVSADWPVAGGDSGGANLRNEMIGDAADWSTVALLDPLSPPGTVDSPLQAHFGRWTAQTALLQYANGLPAAPATRPIAAGHMLYIRTPTNLVGLDVTSGRFCWRSPVDPLCREYLAGSNPETDEGELAARTIFGQRLWTDRTWATASADRTVVFTVEETGAATPLPRLPTETSDMGPLRPTPFNRLVACEATTGRRIGEAGGPSAPPVDDRVPLAGTFFYGAPVPAGDAWYVLGEDGGTTSLHRLTVGEGIEVRWSLAIAEHDDPIASDTARRTAGFSPILCGGLLICPVDADLVVAVDPGTRSLRWACRASTTADLQAARRGGIFHVPVGPVEVSAIDGSILLARARAGITAVEPVDGVPRWKSTEFVCLWLIGLDEARVYVQTPVGVAALNLKDGSPDWLSPAILGAPSGRGVVIGDRLCVPLADSTLAVLDTTSGKTVAKHPAPFREPLGNLIVAGRSLVSQSATRIIAIPFEP